MSIGIFRAMRTGLKAQALELDLTTDQRMSLTVSPKVLLT